MSLARLGTAAHVCRLVKTNHGSMERASGEGASLHIYVRYKSGVCGDRAWPDRGSWSGAAGHAARKFSSVRLHMGSASLVLNKGLQYKSSAHLLLNLFNEESNFTRTEPENVTPGSLPWREAGPPNHLDDEVDSDQ